MKVVRQPHSRFWLPSTGIQDFTRPEKSIITTVPVCLFLLGLINTFNFEKKSFIKHIGRLVWSEQSCLNKQSLIIFVCCTPLFHLHLFFFSFLLFHTSVPPQGSSLERDALRWLIFFQSVSTPRLYICSKKNIALRAIMPLQERVETHSCYVRQEEVGKQRCNQRNGNDRLSKKR